MNAREAYKLAARNYRHACKLINAKPQLYAKAMRQLYHLTRGKPLVRPLERDSIGMYEYRCFLWKAKMVERYYLCGPSPAGRRFFKGD